MPINNFNKPSREELEAFWKGDDETRLRLYSERNRRRADAAEKQFLTKIHLFGELI